MSIEDINYLYKNSIKDNAIIFIESHKRNKSIYQTPSEYSILFDNPFKYVYGVEILDASIPRTMYQIDKTNNNLKIVLGNADYNIYKQNVYNPDSNQYIENTLDSLQLGSYQNNYDYENINYLDDEGTTENSGTYGNGSLLWLRDITLDPQDMNIDLFINKLNEKFSKLETDINNSSVSIANNKKITFKAISNPSTNTSKILIYSGSDATNEGEILDSIPFYILCYDSNMSETLGFNENALTDSNNYNSTITDLEKRNIYMLLNNISINTWNTISQTYYVISSSILTNPYNIQQWTGEQSLIDENNDSIQHPYDINRNSLNNRDRTLLVFEKYDELYSTTHYNDFLIFEQSIKNKIFKTGNNKGDVGKYDLAKSPNNKYNKQYPNFKIPETIEYKVIWDQINFRYIIQNSILNVGDYNELTNNPSLKFILGNTYKFDVSDSSHNQKFCIIKYTGINNANENSTISIIANTSANPNLETVLTIKNNGTNTNGYDITNKQFDKGSTDDETATNLVNLINEIVDNTAQSTPNLFRAGKIDNFDYIFINHLNTDIPSSSNNTTISNIVITNYEYTPEFNFSFYQNGNSNTTNSTYNKSVITKNVIRSGTPGSSNAYIQYNTKATDYGGEIKTSFETPNNFYYLSIPTITSESIVLSSSTTSLFNPHITSGNLITLQQTIVNRVQTPGMINLTGERLIILKSKNIEEHLYKNESGTSSIGIALFKVGSSGYTDNRLDFTNFKPKDFHPIGKLTHLDFRFEIDDNQLYDFKGVNHNLLVNIKYYVPNKILDNMNYTLNSNYNPDFITYKKTQYEKDDESEEELNELSKNFRGNFLEKEKEYEYSSDDDLEYVEPRNNDYSDSDTSESSEDRNNYIPANNNNITPYHPMYKL